MRCDRSFLILTIILLFSISYVLAVDYYGYTKYQNGTALGGVNVTLKVVEFGPDGPQVNSSYSGLSNSSGFFNITVPEQFNNGQWNIKPVFIKYLPDNDTTEYIGPNVPAIPANDFFQQVGTSFYLKRGATLLISGIGDEHFASTINGTNSSSISSDYQVGLEFINDSGNEFLLYINGSDCLMGLNSTRGLNFSACSLNITSIADFTYSDGARSYFIVNNTQVEKCYIGSKLSNVTCNESSDLSGDFSSVLGVEAVSLGPEDYIYVSGINKTGGMSAIAKYYTNLSFISKDMMQSPAGFIEYDESGAFQGPGLYFAANDTSTGIFKFYKCVFQSVSDPVECNTMDSADFSSGVIVSGIARNPFEDKWYFSTASSKNTSEFRFTTTSYSFNYQLKDQGIGYPIYENFDPNSSVDFVTLSLPADRNYSFMVYPQGGPSFPVKIDIANIANGTNVSGCGLIDENLTIDCTGLNLSTNLRRLSGYAIYNSSLSEQNYTNFTIIGYLLESGDMVFSGATLPPNMSQFSPEGGSDIFNTTSGFYNMTVPGAALGANLILFATAAVNLSGTIKYYGGFRNITVGYSGTIPQLNFTLYPLMGSPSNLSTGLGGSGGSGGSSTVYTALKRINFVNETNDTVTGVFTEIMVDYSSVSGSGVSFSWMADAQNGYVELPLINQAGVARIEAFNMNYAPRKGKISKIDLDSSQAYNFTLKKFKPFNPENSSYNTNSINLSFFRSNSECSVPKPGSSCSAMSNTNVSNFNPLTVMMSGAKIDFEMKDPNSGIVVRYIDVDMLASGPPDAIFDPTANSSSSGSSLEEAWRFGSSGPEIYKKVLIGVPYNTTQINSSYTVRINITRFYDDENLNNSFWKQGVNSTSQLSGTDYEEYASDDYKEFINGTGVLCSTSDENLTSSLCYRDSSNGMLWFEIPHFSGIAPTVSASSSTTGPSSPDNDDNDNGGGGNGRGNNDNYFYIFNFLATNKQIEEGYTKSLAKKSMVRFKIGNETHSVGVIEVLTKSVKINVSSKPQQAVLTVGESKKFEVTGDKFYDVLVKLNGIANNRANLTIKKIHEEIKNETNQKKVEDRGEPSNNKSPEEKKEKTKTSLTGIWISLVVIVLIALGWYFSKRYRSSSESETGPLKEKTSGQKRNKKKN